MSQYLQLSEQELPTIGDPYGDIAQLANQIKTEKFVGAGFTGTLEQARQVESLIALGLDPDDVAETLNIDKKTFHKYYKYQIKSASHRTNAAVAKVALEMALRGDSPEMTKFWLKTRAKWRETHEIKVDHTFHVEVQDAKRKLLEGLSIGDDDTVTIDATALLMDNDE